MQSSDHKEVEHLQTMIKPGTNLQILIPSLQAARAHFAKKESDGPKQILVEGDPQLFVHLAVLFALGVLLAKSEPMIGGGAAAFVSVLTPFVCRLDLLESHQNHVLVFP